MKTFIVLFNLLLLASAAIAQNDQNLEANIQAVRNETFRAGQTFLNASLDPASRVDAIKPFPGLLDEGQIAAAKAIVQNSAENPSVRGIALEKLVDQVTSDEELWNTTLAWLMNASGSKEQRSAALNIMRALSFSPFSMFDKNQEIMADLRTLATDSDNEIKDFALNYLSAHGDGYTQNLLINELKSRRPGLVPLADAVGILALDPHGDYLPTINQILQNPPDEASEAQALSVLGSYAPAKNKMNSILRDKKRPARLRQIALANLLQNYPVQAADLSYSIINDGQESDELKAQAVGYNYFKRKTNREKFNRRKADRLDIAIKNLNQKTRSRDLQQLISWYIDEVNPSY